MQDRYVGDIGDYVKLAILRTLSRGRNLGVAWWLFPDECHNADGGHREYLERHDEWKHFDQDLFEALLKIEKEKGRNVQAIEEAAILPNAVFASDAIPCQSRPFSLRPPKRSEWLAGIITKLKDCNIVFLDPDNGIAPEGFQLTRRRAGKSVTIDEIKALKKSNRAIVVYHHQTRFRGEHLSEIRDLAIRLEKNELLVSGALRAKPWAPRAFFILDGDRELQDRAENIADLWKGYISWHPNAELLKSSK